MPTSTAKGAVVRLQVLGIAGGAMGRLSGMPLGRRMVVFGSVLVGARDCLPRVGIRVGQESMPDGGLHRPVADENRYQHER